MVIGLKYLKEKVKWFPTKGSAPQERGLIINQRDRDMINKKSIFVLCKDMLLFLTFL